MRIAIISGLAALLLPTLTQGKASARRIQCAGGLRQFGLAAQMYWDDNSGNCFLYHRLATNNGDLYWFGWLQNGAEEQRAFDATQGALFPYLQNQRIEICPALNYGSSQFKLKAAGAACGYGYNLALSAPPAQPPVNVFKNTPATGIALFADAAQINTFQAPASPSNPLIEEFYYVDADEATAHFRHERMANVVFSDGHVGREKPVPGSIDQRLPTANVGRLRVEIVTIP